MFTGYPNRAMTGATREYPRMLNINALANKTGISYWTIMRRVASGSLRPDATTATGNPLFLETRLAEIRDTLANSAFTS